MRCIFCNRPLLRATVMLAGNPVGPDCARRHNLGGATGAAAKRITRVPRSPPKPKIERDPHTVDMFSGSAAAECDPASKQAI